MSSETFRANGDNNNDAKRLKLEIPLPNPPSRVVHIRNIPIEITEAEVIHLGLPFGQVRNILVLKGKNQVCNHFSFCEAFRECVDCLLTSKRKRIWVICGINFFWDWIYKPLTASISTFCSVLFRINNICVGINGIIIVLWLILLKTLNVRKTVDKIDFQAFLEMDDQDAATAMVNYFTNCSVTLRERFVYVQFSKHQELRTDHSHSNSSASAQAALQVIEKWNFVVFNFPLLFSSLIIVIVESLVYV